MVADVPLMAKSAGKKLMIFTEGSRGDIQPIVALGYALQKAGFVVRITTNVNHVRFVSSFDLDVVGVFTDSEKMINESPLLRETMAKGDMVKFSEALAAENKIYFPDKLARTVAEVDAWEPDVIITTILCQHELIAVSGLRKTPLILITLQSFFPSREQASMAAEPYCFPHRIISTFLMHVFWAGERDGKTSEILKQVPQVEPFMNMTFTQFMLNLTHPYTPIIVGFSPSLYTLKKDWNDELRARIKFAGFWVVPEDEQRAKQLHGDLDFGGSSAENLKSFLAKGAPVYMGWGSMIGVSSEHMACLAVRSLMKAGLRGIILAGWAKLDASKLEGQLDSQAMMEYVKENVMFIKSAPHEWLFPQCAVIVHHGGSGTTAAALRSGVPTVITPCAFDQFENARLAASNGVGFAMPGLSKVTVTRLAATLNRCIKDRRMVARAQALAMKLKSEDSGRETVSVVDEFIVSEVDTGVWKMKFDKRVQEMKYLRTQKPFSCFGWVCRMLCSLAPNDYSVQLPSAIHLQRNSPKNAPVLLGKNLFSEGNTDLKTSLEAKTNR